MQLIPATTCTIPAIFATADVDQAEQGTMNAAEERQRAFRLCAHIKLDGVRCGSPALRRGDFCYFHNRWRLNHPGVAMPFLDNPHAIQFAIMDILRALSSQHIKQADAGTMLYGLQLAIQNLKAVQAGPSGPLVTEDPALRQFDQWIAHGEGSNDADRINEELRKRSAGYTYGRVVED